MPSLRLTDIPTGHVEGRFRWLDAYRLLSMLGWSWAEFMPDTTEDDAFAPAAMA